MPQQSSSLRVGVDSRPMVDGARKGKAALASLGSQAKLTQTTFAGLNSTTRIMTTAFAAMAGLVVVRMFGQMLTAASAFETKMAEVSTLVDVTTFDIVALTEALKDQAVEFGQMPTDQAAAAYQIISAGATSAAGAVETLTVANKLAVGGVTDVATAADGLTSVLNAYGDQVQSAEAVSDALFVGMRAGKTTIGELSSSLGKVAPLAAQAGVGFDELVASVSALTKGGIKTTEAVTGIRAIMAAIVKPTKEAADLASQLGLDFSSAALEAKGLSGFLEDLIQRTGGSTDAMAQLFGGVEALVPILALAGQAGVDFRDILEDMETKAGATQAAFETMTNTFDYQAGRLKAALIVAFIELGSVITTALIPAIKFLADNFDTISKAVGVLAAVIATKLVIALGTSLVTATTAAVAQIIALEIALGATSTAAAFMSGVLKIATSAFRALTVAMLANPFGLLAVAIAAVVTYFWLFNDSANETAAAIEVVNVALTEEIRQVDVLTSQLQSSNRMSTQAATAKLREAEARQVNIEALIREKEELFTSSDAYITLTEQIDRMREALNAKAPAGSDLEDLPAHLRDSYAELEESLASLVTQQTTLWSEFREGTEESRDALFENQKNIEAIRAAIENAKDGMVNFNGSTNNANDSAVQLAGNLREAENALWQAAMAGDRFAGSLGNAVSQSMQIAAALQQAPGAINDLSRQAAAVEERMAMLNRGDYIEHLEKRYGLAEAAGTAEVAYISGVINRQMTEFDNLQRLNTEYARRNALATGGGGGGGGGGTSENTAFIDALDREYQAVKASTEAQTDLVNTWYANQKQKLADLGLAHSAYADMLEVVFTDRLAAAYATDLQNATDWRSGIELAVKDLGASISSEADLAGAALTSLFNNAASAIVEFAKTGKFNFAEFARSVAADILMMTTKMLLLGAIKKMFGFAEGGMVPGFAGGGMVPGYASGGKVFGPGTGTSDSINAKLSAGEFVVNAAATKDNLPLLSAINSGGTPVGEPAEGDAGAMGDVSIINVLDPSIVGKYLSTVEGRRAIVNIIEEERV